MSGLKDKLKRLKAGQSAGPRTPEGTPVPTGADEPICSTVTEGPISSAAANERSFTAANEPCSSTEAASIPSSKETELEPGWTEWGVSLESNEWGHFLVRRAAYSLDYRHGHYRLGELGECAAHLAPLAENRALEPEEMLFFDTESTGLGQGAGNVPFMIGLGRFLPGTFLVEQLFIRNPAEERAMLAYLLPLLQQASCLVTYNGKTFDWPLLQTRYVLNRMTDRLPQPLHLDFLHPSRSLWRHTLPSCRLGKVEEEKLGLWREDDVPGSLAPMLYVRYLAEQDPQVIGPVFLHNESDVLSLAGLAIHFARILEGRVGTDGMDGEERYRLGLWLHKHGRRELARAVLDELAQEAASGDGTRRDYLLPLAKHFKQQGQWDKAMALWKAAIELGRSGAWSVPPVEPYVELAMVYEHRMKEFETALLYAMEARQIREERLARLASALGAGRLRSSGSRQTERTERQDEILVQLDRRIERLSRKLSGAVREGQPDNHGGNGRRSAGRRRKAGGACEPLTLF